MRKHFTIILAILVAAGPAPGQTPAAPVRTSAPGSADSEPAGSEPTELIAPIQANHLPQISSSPQHLFGMSDAETTEEPAAVDVVARPERFWFRAEYLLWGIKDSRYPPLVTTGPSTDPRPGALDSGSTSVLFGGRDLSNKDRSGGRFFTGWWFDDDHAVGVEAGYFFLGARSVGTFQSSPGNPVLARPFFNANMNIQDSSLDSFPGLASGAVKVDVPSFLQGAEGNVVAALVRGPKFRLEALAGFRYLSLQESLHVSELVEVGSNSPQFPSAQIAVADMFDTKTNFYGGQLGARAEFRHKRWFLSVITKVALGDSNQAVDIHGLTVSSAQPVANAGLLALASNSGHFTRDSFGVVPEIGGNLGFQFTQHIRGFVGYSFLYWTNVARPGDQVDTVINVNQVPTSVTFGAAGGPARPAFLFHSTDFYAHGVNFGLEFRF
jgi:hypothetical protein